MPVTVECLICGCHYRDMDDYDDNDHCLDEGEVDDDS